MQSPTQEAVSLFADGRASGVCEGTALQLSEKLHGLLGIATVHELSERLCASARELLGAQGATFVLSEGDDVYYANESAEERLWHGRRFPASACISGWVAQHCETAAITDVYADARIPQDVYRPTFVRSLAMAPMVSGEQVSGALGVYWSTRHETTGQELFLLETLATAGGRALEQARMLEECRRLRAPGDEGGSTGTPLAHLLPSVAHDLRSPLSAISQALEVLTVERELSRGGRTAVDGAVRSSRRMARMVSQLMDFSAIDSQGGLPLQLDRTDLKWVAEQVAREVPGFDGDTDLVLEAEPVVGLWDADRLLEAVENLVRNAIEHGESRRTITICVRDTGSHARVSVHNWGTPIPEEARASLFEPFQRRDPRTGSIGLGLYISSQIVDGHGGCITIDSCAETGTTFAITLPKDPATFQ
ncbi:MAG: ATP-binding protein [Pseudomonadota bacterium]